MRKLILPIVVSLCVCFVACKKENPAPMPPIDRDMNLTEFLKDAQFFNTTTTYSLDGIDKKQSITAKLTNTKKIDTIEMQLIKIAFANADYNPYYKNLPMVKIPNAGYTFNLKDTVFVKNSIKGNVTYISDLKGLLENKGLAFTLELKRVPENEAMAEEVVNLNYAANKYEIDLKQLIPMVVLTDENTPKVLLKNKPVLSLPIPSGLNGDGQISIGGEMEYFVYADMTTEQKAKIGAVVSVAPGYTVKYFIRSTETDKFSGEVTSMKIYSPDNLVIASYNVMTTAKQSLKGGEKYNFDLASWNHVNGQYYDPKGWGTSNSGLFFMKLFGWYPAEAPYIVTPLSDAGNDVAVLLTAETQGDGGMIPRVTSGSLFTGEFEPDMTNTLKSTKFGHAYMGKTIPQKVTGRFKYLPGPIFYNNMNEDKTGKVDKCALSVVVYEVSSYSETLDGTNIFTAKDKIVAMAQLINGKQETYKNFSLDLKMADGKTFDPVNRMYKLAVIFSSSADGDKFEGAPGSLLYIDDVEIVMPK